MAYSDTLMAVTGQTGALTGNWFTVAPGDGKTLLSVVVSVAAGTATFFIEGRNGPNDAAVSLGTASASGAYNVIRTKQVRLRLSAASGATVRATVGEPVRTTV